MPLADRQAILAAIIGTAAVAAAFTFCAPILSLLMERGGKTNAYIGLFAMVGAVTTVMITPIAPRLLQRFESRKLMVGLLIIAAAVFPLYYVFNNFTVWFLLRYIQGLATTLVFVTSETWINQIAPEKSRGRILSLYAIGLSGGFALGSGSAAILVKFYGLDGILPYVIGAAITLVGVLPFLSSTLTRLVPPSAEEASFSALGRIFRAAPAILMGALVFGAIEYALFSLLPVYGVKIGMTESYATALLLALPIGNIVLQWPIGVMADSLNRRRLLAALLLTCVICGVVMCLVGSHWIGLFITLALFAGAATGTYTLGLVLLGERFKGAKVVAANAAFILMYGFGSLGSPVLSGLAMDVIGPIGFPIILTAIAATGLLVVILRQEGVKTPS